METGELEEPVPAAEREQALIGQLRLYARDLKRMLHRERNQSTELAAANERLGRLDRLKLDFLALVSHELRTPLTSMAVVELLDPASLEPQHAEIVRLITSGYARLERFVARAVDYFQALACLDDAVAGPVDFTALVRTSVEALGPGHRAELSLTGERCQVRAVEGLLGRVLRTILDNALKHSDGEPRIAIRSWRAGARVCLEVRDHGRGFPPEMAGEITRVLTPADILHHSEGSALNLSLAAQIVASLGGRLTAASAGPGTGATFTIELPSVEPAAMLPGELA